MSVAYSSASVFRDFHFPPLASSPSLAFLSWLADNPTRNLPDVIVTGLQSFLPVELKRLCYWLDEWVINKTPMYSDQCKEHILFLLTNYMFFVVEFMMA